MLHSALTISALSVLCSTSLHYTEDEPLAISEVEDSAFESNRRHKPLPAMLETQITSIWIDMMAKIQKKVLANLKRKIFERQRKDWYTST